MPRGRKIALVEEAAALNAGSVLTDPVTEELSEKPEEKSEEKSEDRKASAEKAAARKRTGGAKKASAAAEKTSKTAKTAKTAKTTKSDQPEKSSDEKKTTAKKTAEAGKAQKKKLLELNTFYQFGGRSTDMQEIVDSCLADWKAAGGEEVESIDIYLKPEDRKAYYVINKSGQGFIDL